MILKAILLGFCWVYFHIDVEFTKKNDAISFTAVCASACSVSTDTNFKLSESLQANIEYFHFYRDTSGSRKGRHKDYTPVMWNEHFTEKEDVVVDDEHTFRVYFTNRDTDNKQPLLVLLHGGGYSALTWAHFCVCRKCQTR